MSDRMEHVPAAVRGAFAEIVALTDEFRDVHLNEEYRQLSRKMAVAVCQQGLPVAKGKRAGWASAILYTLGQVNCLGDPSQTPHMTAAEVAKGFGVSQATTMAKAKIVRENLDLIPMHPEWYLPSRLEYNPLVWMLHG